MYLRRASSVGRQMLALQSWHGSHESWWRKSWLAGLLFVYGCSSAGQAGYDRTLSFCGFLSGAGREGPALSVSKQYDTELTLEKARGANFYSLIETHTNLRQPCSTRNHKTSRIKILIWSVTHCIQWREHESGDLIVCDGIPIFFFSYFFPFEDSHVYLSHASVLSVEKEKQRGNSGKVQQQMTIWR